MTARGRLATLGIATLTAVAWFVWSTGPTTTAVDDHATPRADPDTRRQSVTADDAVTRDRATLDPIAVAPLSWDLPPVTGVVTDESGLPLAGVTVSSRGLLDRHEKLAAMTDADGWFEVPFDLPELRTLVFRDERHVPCVWGYAVAGESRRVVMVAGVPVTGRVLDEQGRPLAGAEVMLQSPAVLTDADGRFRAVAPDPCITARVSAEGYLPWSRSPLPLQQGPIEVRMRPPPEGDALHVRLLEHESGSPIEADRLRFRPGPATLLESSGLWRITMWTPGVPLPYDLPNGHAAEVEIEGRPDLQFYWWVHTPGRPGRKPAHPIELSVPRDVITSGRVVDPSGAPVDGARVRAAIASANSGELAAHVPEDWLEVLVETDADGQFEIDRLIGGFSYEVWIEHPHVVADRVSWSVPLTAQFDAPPILVRPGRSIGVRVVDGDTDEPIAGASARLGWRSAISDEGGTIEMRGLRTDDQLRIGAPGFLATTLPVSDLVEIEPSVIRLQRGLSIRGRVIDGLGRPVPGANIRYRRTSRVKQREIDHGWSDADGAFRIAGLSDEEHLVAAERHGRTSERARLRPNGPDVTLTLREPCGVVGRVVDAVSGEPVPRFWCRGPYDDINAEGSFFFAGEPGVPLELPISADGYAPARRRFVLAVGEIREWTVRLERESVIEGVLHDPSGRPSPGVQIQIDQGGYLSRGRTDSEGRFRITQLGAGTWRFRIPAHLAGKTPDGERIPFDLDPDVVTVTTGQRVKVDLHVRPR